MYFVHTGAVESVDLESWVDYTREINNKIAHYNTYYIP